MQQSGTAKSAQPAIRGAPRFGAQDFSSWPDERVLAFSNCDTATASRRYSCRGSRGFVVAGDRGVEGHSITRRIAQRIENLGRVGD